VRCPPRPFGCGPGAAGWGPPSWARSPLAARLEAQLPPSWQRGRDELRDSAASGLPGLLGGARGSSQLGRSFPPRQTAMSPGLVVVISGPGGVGKDTLIEKLLERDDRLRYS